MLNIVIKTIPHSDQRYDTIGDWIWDVSRKKLTIHVSNMDNWKYELLVGFHELCEVMLCEARGISQEAVDAFDFNYELNRKKDDDTEPGDNKDAPYKKEHFFATSLERLLCAELGVDWNEYDEKIRTL